MEMKLVESSNITAVGYDATTHELNVQFSSGAIYAYYDVPEEVYAAFSSAESKGRYFRNSIKENFRYQKINY